MEAMYGSLREEISIHRLNLPTSRHALDPKRENPAVPTYYLPRAACPRNTKTDETTEKNIGGPPKPKAPQGAGVENLSKEALIPHPDILTPAPSLQ